jgi:hypothetical protein
VSDPFKKLMSLLYLMHAALFVIEEDVCVKH